MIFDSLISRFGDCHYGLLNARGWFLQATNPFLLGLYTKETLAIMVLGTLVSFIQVRLILAFVPLALLTMNYSKMRSYIYYACVLWTILLVAYQFYTQYSFYLHTTEPLWATAVGLKGMASNFTCN